MAYKDKRMKRNYCVYIHTNKINGKKYVGITKQDPIQRWEYGHGYKNCPKMWNAIKKYGWSGFTHEVVINNLTRGEAIAAEISLIKTHDTVNNGYNVSEGGDIPPVHNARPVQQIDYKSGKVLAEYDSVCEAARTLGINHDKIYAVLYGKQVRACGFTWCYSDTKYNNRRIKMGNSRAVVSEDDEGRIQEYYSISEAARQNKVTDVAIRTAIIHDRKSANKRWKYVDAD